MNPYPSPAPDYSLLLDVVAPVDAHRANLSTWDPDRWGRLLEVADWHRLLPALFNGLKTRAGVPAPVLGALERAYLTNAARTMFIRENTARVLAALERADVRSILLKGAALIETVYTDPAEREMLDVDVLLHDDRVERATAALAELGYSYREEPGLVSRAQPEPVLVGSGAPHHGAALVAPGDLVAVELHHHIAISDEGGSFSLAGFWERARIAEPTGHAVPSDEDLLLHVCFHFTRNRLGGTAHHRNTRGALAQILDIRRLVAQPDLDWDLVTRTSREFRLGTRVFLALFAAHELGVPVPDDALRALRPHGFDAALGRRLVTLRVLRSGDHLPVRSMRWMLAPSREALRRGWNADPNATLSLARAYVRRATAHVPEARSTLQRPWNYVQDRRLNNQIAALPEST